MKLLKLANKELKLIRSQKKALALILMYPIVVIFALALAFGGPALFGDTLGERTIDTSQVPIYIPQDSAGFESEEFWGQINAIQGISFYRVESVEQLKQTIRFGHSRAGFVVNPPDNINSQLKVDLYFDNSALLASKAIASQVRFAINRVGYAEAQEILGGIWSDLDSIERNLMAEKGNTNQFMGEIRSAEEQIGELNSSLEEVDLGSIEQDLDSFDDYYEDTKEQLNQAEAEMVSSLQLVNSYRVKLVDARTELNEYSAELKEVRSELVSIRDQIDEPLKSELNSWISELDGTISKIDSTIADIDTIMSELDSTKVKLDSVGSEITAARERLEDVKGTVVGFRTTLGGYEATIEDIKSMTSEATTVLESTKEKLVSTNEMLTSLITTLEGFRQYKPSYLVNPVILFEKEIFQVSELALMVPLSIALVLLLTCMLLTAGSVIIERREGVYTRLNISPTSQLSWVFGKVIGQMFFALLEAGIILVIAFLLFGIPLPVNPFDLLIVLAVISFAFVSLGMFITNFTNTQSTAILGSLLIMIPMLFLSGMLFPIEFMPYLVSVGSGFLPLTLANNMLMNVMIKGMPLSMMAASFVLLLIPSVLMLIITIKWREVSVFVKKLFRQEVD